MEDIYHRTNLKDVPTVGPVKLVDVLGGVPKLVAGEVVGGVAFVTRYVGRGEVNEEEDGDDDRGQREHGGQVRPHCGCCNARVGWLAPVAFRDY